MGVTKSQLFTQSQNEMAYAAKVLGHPARIAILEHLISTKKCVNGDLVDELGLAQATISQHLRELKQAGIIQGTIEGTSVCYCIEPVKWNLIESMFSQFFGRYKNVNCC